MPQKRYGKEVTYVQDIMLQLKRMHILKHTETETIIAALRTTIDICFDLKKKKEKMSMYSVCSYVVQGLI